MSTKSKGTSVAQKLAGLAKKTEVQYENLATEFLIERLVARLVANKDLHKSLVFKGGFVGLRVYDSKRYTVDLDALLLKSNITATLEKARAAAETDLGDGVWFRFESQVDLKAQGEYGGIRQSYRTGFGEILKKLSKAQIINFDLGIGDPVTPIPSTTKALISGEDLSWSIYPLETIAAEKLHAVVELGEINSRSKDIHDLVQFLPRVDKKLLHESLKRCFAYRETPLPERISETLKEINTTVLERGWANAVASVKPAPKFSATFAKLISLLEKFDF